MILSKQMKLAFGYANPWTFVLLAITVTIPILSCDSIVVEEPNFLLSDSFVFADDNTAESAVLGIYSEIMGGRSFASGGQHSITFLSGLSADNFTSFSFQANESQFYNNSLLATNSNIEFDLWNAGYKLIYSANAILEGLGKSTVISAETKQRLEGEVKFIRAFSYFYLTNLFGNVPLVTTTDYLTNRRVRQSPPEEIYRQIIIDLEAAKGLLPKDYSFYSNERVRPNSFAANALLARVYLYTEQWAMAENEATQVISKTDLFHIENDLNAVFLKNSEEAIWQLMPVVSGLNTWEGSVFILNFTPPSPIVLTDNLMDAFDTGDMRMTSWTASISDVTHVYYYPFKYRIKSNASVTEYSMVLRLAEQYLIRAEAKARQGNLVGAQMDLNTIRNRAGLPDTVADDMDSLMDAIEQERRSELFAEWGHRWLDLKRTGRAGAILSKSKSEWQDTDILYPIPQKELQNNPNLTQNRGY